VCVGSYFSTCVYSLFCYIWVHRYGHFDKKMGNPFDNYASQVYPASVPVFQPEKTKVFLSVRVFFILNACPL